MVSEPGPKSVPTQSVSASRQATLDFASGSVKPPATNALVDGVELADHGGVGAAAGQRDQALAVVRAAGSPRP